MISRTEHPMHVWQCTLVAFSVAGALSLSTAFAEEKKPPVKAPAAVVPRPVGEAKPVVLPQPPAGQPSGPAKTIFTGETHWTAVSGYTGLVNVVLGASDADYQGGVSIQWFEDSDDACKVTFYTRHFNVGDSKPNGYEKCYGSSGNEKWVARRGESEYITALQVCTTDKSGDSAKNKLKGIRLWGRVLDAAKATLGPVNPPDDAIHTHCKDWSKKVECPAGEVAAQIRVYMEDRVVPMQPTHSMAKGIALGCRKVAPKP